MVGEKELIERVRALMKMNDYEGSRALLLTNDVIARSRADLSWRMGWACFKLDLFAEACDWLSRSLELKPVNHGVRWVLGEAYAVMGKVHDAERELLRSISIRDSNEARHSLGFLYHRAGRTEEAEAVYVEGLRLRPDDPDRCEAYADFLSETGHAEEAEEYKRRAGFAQQKASDGEPPFSA